MKKLTFIVLVALFAQTSFGQSSKLLVETKSTYYSPNYYQQSSENITDEYDRVINWNRTVSEYDENNRLIGNKNYYLSNGKETLISYTKNTYNSAGFLTQFLSYNYSYSNKDFQIVSENHYEYNEKNQLLIQHGYNSWNGSQNNEFENLYEYDEHGIVSQTTMRSRIGDNDWVESVITQVDATANETAITWIEDPETGEMIRQAGFSNSLETSAQITLVPVVDTQEALEQNVFDDQGKIVTYYSKYRDPYTGKTYATNKMNYEYNEQGLVVRTSSMLYNVTCGTWNDHTYTRNEYDENGNILKIEQFFRHHLSNQWIISQKTEYTYKAPFTKDEKTLKILSVYPNPSSDYITISIENTELTNDVEIIVRDINSNVIFSQYKKASQDFQIGISDLLGGVYSITLTSEDNLLSGKFMKID